MLILVLLVAAVPAFAQIRSVPAAAVSDVRPTSAGWTLPAAVRAVALQNPALALPPGVSLAAIEALPTDSPIWTRTAKRLATTPTLHATPEAMVRASLEAIGGAKIRSLSRNDPSSARDRALARNQIGAERLRAVAASGIAALAAADVDPGLLVAQFGIQQQKDLIREIWEYNELIAPRGAAIYSRPNRAYESSRAVVPHAETLIPLLQRADSLNAMVENLRERHGRVVWADAGGGFGVAQRQWSRDSLGPDVKRVLVDLFDWERLPPAVEGHRSAVHALGSSTFEGCHRPDLVLADVSSIQFPRNERPNLITSIESIQYWPDKIRGLVNLYNQLQDGGVLAIAAEHRWGSWISTNDGSLTAYRSTLFDDMIAALSGAGIEIAAIVRPGWTPLDDLRSLVILKKMGTVLIQNAHLDKVGVGFSGYSASYYGDLHGRAPIEVATDNRPQGP